MEQSPSPTADLGKAANLQSGKGRGTKARGYKEHRESRTRFILHSNCDSVKAWAAAGVVISRVQIDPFPPTLNCHFPANLTKAVKMWMLQIEELVWIHGDFKASSPSMIPLWWKRSFGRVDAQKNSNTRKSHSGCSVFGDWGITAVGSMPQLPAKRRERFCMAEKSWRVGQGSNPVCIQQAGPDVLRRNLSPQRGGGFETFSRAGGWETSAACRLNGFW